MKKKILYLSLLIFTTGCSKNTSIPQVEPIENTLNFATNDWIKITQHNPEIMKQPFALMGDTIIFAETRALSLNIVRAYDK